MAPESFDLDRLRLQDAGVVRDFPDAEAFFCDGAGVESLSGPDRLHHLHAVRGGVVEELYPGNGIHHRHAAASFQGVFRHGEQEFMVGWGGVVESSAAAYSPGLAVPSDVADVRRGLLFPAYVRVVFAPVEPVGEFAVFEPRGAGTEQANDPFLAVLVHTYQLFR